MTSAIAANAGSSSRSPWSPSACLGAATVHRPVVGGWATRELGAPLPLNPRQRSEDSAGRWHGQHAQDRAVATLLGEKRGGFYLDMAASEPFMHSNTRTLERDFGWHGVCIEANQHFWHKLVSWRRCCVVGAAVAEKRAEEGYHFYGPYAGCGGLVRSGTDNAGRKEVLRVQTVPLSEILQRFAVPRTIDFMSLDVEGAESLVMSGFPFETHTVSVLLIERPKRDLEETLARHGYRYHCTSVGSSASAQDQVWLSAAFVPAAGVAANTQRSSYCQHGRASLRCTVRCEILHANATLMESVPTSASRRGP